MFSYIKGTLEEIEEGYLVVENHGIGYQIQTSADVSGKLPSIGSEIKIYTYFHVKEDGLALFGFLEKETLRIFQLLLRVNGIGPKGALGILSALSVADLRFAVLAGDVKAISKAPGIGAKSAQRIILELKDKLDIAEVFEESGAKPEQQKESSAKNEAVQALVALGYSSSEALSAVTKAEVSPDADVEEILKVSLKQMALV